MLYSAMVAGLRIYPEEILDLRLGAAFQTLGVVEGADLFLQAKNKIFRSFSLFGTCHRLSSTKSAVFGLLPLCRGLF